MQVETPPLKVKFILFHITLVYQLRWCGKCNFENILAYCGLWKGQHSISQGFVSKWIYYQLPLCWNNYIDFINFSKIYLLWMNEPISLCTHPLCSLDPPISLSFFLFHLTTNQLKGHFTADVHIILTMLRKYLFPYFFRRRI